MTAHFTVQHSHMLKRRKPQRDSMTAAVERELPHDLSSPLGASLSKRRGNTSDTATDPLLLSFISYPSSVDDQEANSDIARRGGVSSVHAQSLKPSMANQILEHDLEVLSQRAEFFQQMLLSTIF
ncbi:putative protein DEHYDRATION-INDUCED 19-like protein 6 isoform X1 [Iris pallida]|uniref:Di19 C-terminal domain-containing protein n=1 Tax=Iris pallida TaxID=29817 RepID=A0AAX6FCY4_IRIPA|nr:putative protein DEHYDRATION-INDUCED 19-like protein 6 isoform X1 [Iris pallida]